MYSDIPRRMRVNPISEEEEEAINALNATGRITLDGRPARVYQHERRAHKHTGQRNEFGYVCTVEGCPTRTVEYSWETIIRICIERKENKGAFKS